MTSTYEDYVNKYKFFVTKNPLLASEIEVALKWASYVVAGRFSQSPVITELIHTASKLLTLINDSILRKAAGIPVNTNLSIDRLHTYITIIEYSEVFTEVTARQLNGARGKWLMVIVLQVAKFILRALLLLKHNQGLHITPPIPPLNRQKEIPQLCSPTHVQACPNVQVTFTLKTSGRVMRTLEAAPPLLHRTWKPPPQSEENSSSTMPRNPSLLTRDQTAGEFLHMLKPLVHLASMGTFGEFSWKPWFLSLAMDLSSLHLLKQKTNFTKQEKQELSRRSLCIVLYLLRSPFYDKYSKLRILALLQAISNNIFGTGFLLRPLMEYLPEWQQIYFYTWSS